MRYLRTILVCCVLGFASVQAESLETPIEEKRMNKIRMSHGPGTFSTMTEIFLKWDLEVFDDVTQFGIAYERYLYKDLYDDSFDFSLQACYFRHDEGPYGNFINQFNFGIKTYWTRFPWSRRVETKVFATGGLSYTDGIVYIEDINDEDESRVLFYVEGGFELNLGHLTTINSLDSYYIGAGISHRSGGFGTFSNVHGGSNYVMFFIAKEF